MSKKQAHILELLVAIVAQTSFGNALYSASTLDPEKVAGLVLHQVSILGISLSAEKVLHKFSS
jgi:hypothetical protein